MSTPAELPVVRIAYRAGQSTYKRALGALQADDVLTATGVRGDFVLPRRDVPLLLVAAAIA